MSLKHYIEIKIEIDKNEPKAMKHKLMQYVFRDLHLMLVEGNNANKSSIGISFPDYDESKYSPGSKIRLFAKTKAALLSLNLAQQMLYLSAYVDVSEIKATPKNATYASFARVNIKRSKSKENLAHRCAKRKNITLREALKMYADYEVHETTLPYVNAYSPSTNQCFRLFVKKTIKTAADLTENFSCYGLSPVATVPIF